MSALEALAGPGGDEGVDPLPWELDDEAPPLEHGEDLAVRPQPGGLTEAGALGHVRLPQEAGGEFREAPIGNSGHL